VGRDFYTMVQFVLRKKMGIEANVEFTADRGLGSISIDRLG